jgi:hypothetical protein
VVSEYELNPFEGDAAADAMAELEEGPDLDVLVAGILRDVLRERGGFLSLGEAETGLAVACLVSAKLQEPPRHDEAERWLAETGFMPNDDHKSLACAVIARVTRPERNDLHEAWTIAGDAGRWMEAIAPYAEAVAPFGTLSTKNDREAHANDEPGIELFFEEPGVLAALQKLSRASDRRDLLIEEFDSYLDDSDPSLERAQGAIALACLAAARYSGDSMAFALHEWLAKHVLDMDDELARRAHAVIQRGYQRYWLRTLKEFGSSLQGTRFVPRTGDLVPHPKGEKIAYRWARTLRRATVYARCESQDARAEVLWAAARTTELTGRQVEVTFDIFGGSSAFIPTPSDVIP